MRRGQIFRRQIRSGLDEAVRIECDTTIEPPRVGYRACHDENVADIVSLDRVRFVVPPSHALEVVASLERCDFCRGRKTIAGFSSMRRIR